jgi:hypothetical protein
MSEMIDRVARVVAEKQGIVFDALPEFYREIWREKARSAIEAMREPTVPMLVAAGKVLAEDEYAPPSDRRMTWGAMIDAALE